MLKKIMSRLLLLVMITFFLTGCLTTEIKEYTFRLNSDGSGSGEVKYVNLVSEEDEGKDVSFSDFDELINDYIKGEQFETDNPQYTVTNKTLFEENGQLCGKVEFTFNSISDINLFGFEDCECAPLMFYFEGLSETMLETNGTKLREDDSIPLIYWDKNATEFTYKTQVKEEMSDAHSLLPLYKIWADTQD